MFACSFMFVPGNLDDEFFALDSVIDDYARSLDGFVGVDRWWSEDKQARNVVYFFRDKETVSQFAQFPDHVKAKREYAKWYQGYHVVISEVTATYGDGRMPGLTLS